MIQVAHLSKSFGPVRKLARELAVLTGQRHEIEGGPR
jgi:hypothetical protein